ncbi:MAG: DUF1259 domain-containing protein [Deltaproteobacteria bacterium]|nr:DUF1259 domain-containing protein [Deltaproteobacteria bacterium]
MRRLVAVALAVAVAGCGLLRKPEPEAAVETAAPVAAPPAKESALPSKGQPVATLPAPASPALAPLPPLAGTSGLDTVAIEEASGLTGAVMPDGVFRITKPRGDLKVTLDGFPITPRMGLAGWVAFRPHASGAMLVGLMPVAADELQAVVSALANAGLEATALHGHFVGEEPRVLFVHFDGVGNPVALARGVRDVQEAIVRVRAARPQKAAAAEARSDLDVAHLDLVLGLRGEHENGVYRVAIPRADLRAAELGVALGATMSPTSWAAFQGSSERAAVAGELMLAPSELQPVIHALRQSRIGVVGIHDNSSREEPRLVFVSFWGVGRPDALAAGVRKALDQLPRGG